ncbi:hypothetical protein ACOT81_33090 [Streptomyces sp. WI04-05B]|uniref:hypothetical protein n=1 Tax=Streptomyces TaxID=1883 RepID=UPI0029A28FA1|nr:MULTISPECIES: hypothetical protein [unclassified Streptomyces]MDX2547035.1 hypothetical protein [Streptomyces sp. WI04-05B]MDX2589724.1 hypothetical protein [Streptomyces sp. WI04-05A]MDX3753174.1 hypothetical protein [Streptomyces sp. AK08-02]
MVHNALTAVPLSFTGREGAFLEEPFNIRLGFYRENRDALAYAVPQCGGRGVTPGGSNRPHAFRSKALSKMIAV